MTTDAERVARLRAALLKHPSRLSWITLEFMRPIPWSRRFANAWWQFRWYDHPEKYRELLNEHFRRFTEGAE